MSETMSASLAKLATMSVLVLHLANLPLALAAYTDVDFVNPAYILNHNGTADTAAARQAIIDGANQAAKNGALSARSTDNIAASGDPGDYLSWSPYWWPDCHFCDSSNPSVTTASTSTSAYDNHRRRSHPKRMDATTTSEQIFTDETAPSTPSSTMATSTIASSATDSTWVSQDTATASDDEVPIVFQPVIKHNDAKRPTKTTSQIPPTSSSSTFATSNNTVASATSTSLVTATSSCQASPTTFMSPSATYTTCPYVRRDGQVNPDTRNLPSHNLFTASQAIFLNAIAYGLTGTQSYADTAVSFIRTLFLDPTSAINPDANYAQVVRGPPGNQTGSYTGVVDFRVLVKVVNAVMVLRDMGNEGWKAEDEAMKGWAGKYLAWLHGSEQGKQAGDAKNNHATFYYAQSAALQMMLGDEHAAISTIQAYFNGPFNAQIASNGEQPYEASRSDAYHYRCFNLEAMITNAKIGHALGLDTWSTTTADGATIQTAINYAMTLEASGD